MVKCFVSTKITLQKIENNISKTKVKFIDRQKRINLGIYSSSVKFIRSLIIIFNAKWFPLLRSHKMGRIDWVLVDGERWFIINKNLAKYLTNNHSLRDTVHVGRLMPPFSNIEGWALIFLFL